jgi:arylsulfatase A-like enzyme
MKMKLILHTLILAVACIFTAPRTVSAQSPSPTSSRKPKILVMWGDDIGIADVTAYSDGLMGFETPNIDRIAKEGICFLHYYGEQSRTAGRSAFLTGQHIIRTGLSKVACDKFD